MSRRRELLLIGLFGLLVAVAAVSGAGVRATYGAQTTADEPQYLLSALSLWEDGNLDISDELADERYRDFHEADLPTQTLLLEGGRRISPHDPLLPLLLAAPMGLGGWAAAKAVLAVLGGCLAALTLWTARRRLRISIRTAHITAGVFAVSAPLAIYSTQVYPEVPAALALVGGLAAVLGPFERRGRIVFVISVVALPWLAVKYVPVASVLALSGLIKAGKGHRSGLLVAFTAAGAAYVAGHLAIYGGLTAYATGDHFVGGELTAVGSQVNLWGRSTRLVGLLADRGFGIGAWQPAFFLLPPAAGWAVARKQSELVVAGCLAVVGWLVATFVALTMHGWWFPGRQVVVVLPMAVLLMGAWVDAAPSSRTPPLVALGSLGVVAFGYLVVGGLQGGLTWAVDFGATTNPLYRVYSAVLPDYLSPGTMTWVLHGVWVAIAAALALSGWRGGSVRRDKHPEPKQRESHQRVST